MSSDITEISDYSALRQLAAALWKENNSYYGAAIMVGAGFSRVASHTGSVSKKMPIWNDLSKVLNKQIGGENYTDPLRLAEEYSAYFGKQALRDLIKNEINDLAWEPGVLHSKLLNLPWSEVLTTNWDTLLERASSTIHNPIYSIVNRQEDLACSPSPRIVKLHGTVNITEDIVFTQEDFRRYPQNHAAFVNFARQTFIENELCLLGFSGDDPNFLQWAGWVRDHLATHTRRIYLVGVLKLTSARRKYLESINIAPIDLSETVADHDDVDYKHLEATRIFIEALETLQPKPTWEWQPKLLRRATQTIEERKKTFQDANYAARLLENQLPLLKKDRETYPDWLVCPTWIRRQLEVQISDPPPSQENLLAMTAESRAQLLYEIAWRHKVTYKVVPSWLMQEMLVVCASSKPCVLDKKQQMEIALLLLKNTRWFDDDAEIQSIRNETIGVLESNAKYWSESSNELAFYRAIVARDEFNYLAIESAIEKINTAAPVWKLRKASFLAEIGLIAEGENLVGEAYRELLEQYRKERNSIYILSRLAWAQWLLNGVSWVVKEKFQIPWSSYQDKECSPWDHIEDIQKCVSNGLENQQKQDIEPEFEPGYYRDNSSNATSSSELHPLVLLDGISNATGTPLRWFNRGLLVEPATKLVQLNYLGISHQLSLSIRAATSDTSVALKTVLSRIRIACLSQEEASLIMNRCTEAVNYWETKLTDSSKIERNYAIERLRVFMEALARIAVRATPLQAKEILQKALLFGKKSSFYHHWLVDALNNLIEYSLKSIPRPERADLLLGVLSFPLLKETQTQNNLHGRWPNPVIDLPGKRQANTALDRRIEEIIESIAPCSQQSTPALLRLLPLIERNFLTPNECRKITEKIWGTNPDYSSLPPTGLFAHELLKLPAQDKSAVIMCVRKHLFDVQGEALFNQFLLQEIANAAHGAARELPTQDQAAIYFERLTAWRAKADDAISQFFSGGEEKTKSIRIGQALAYSIVPALSPEALNQENFDKLLAFYDDTGSPATVIAISCFAATNDIFSEQVGAVVRNGLRGLDAEKVALSAHALLKWREKKSSHSTDRLISGLIYLLTPNQERGLPAMLWTARKMYGKDYLSNTDVDELIKVVPEIFDGTVYLKISPDSRQAVSVSWSRAECVRLARDVLKKSKIENKELRRVLEEAKQDSLPEVRFAEMTDDE